MKEFDRIEQLIVPECGSNLTPGYNFKLSFEGASFSYGNKPTLFTSPNTSIELIDKVQNENFQENIYSVTYKNMKLEVEVLYEFFTTTSSVKQTVSYKNIGDESVVLTSADSAVISGLCVDGLLPWYADGKVIVHFCNMTWQGEAQWKHVGLTELGVYPNTTHMNHKSFDLRSTGSWSTGSYYPMVILENSETGKSFYLELEPSGSWEIKVSNPSVGFAEDGYIAVEATCADINHDGWFITLKSNETYTANPSVYGCVDGGFEEAVAELLKYKRETNAASYPDNKVLTAYNCYMNGIWSNPRTHTLLPLIDSASELGLEVFCIDAGWFRDDEDTTKNAIGDYVVADGRFPGYGLKGILEYIKAKGMIPGIWLEVECCQNMGGFGYTLSENCLCKRHGKPLGNFRAFYDLRDSAVRKHLHNVIDMLCDMGVGFIKNDYNQTTGIGFSSNSESLAVEYPECFDALISFFDEVRAKHPDLIIENCGSGAMRCDNNILKHFELQSSSDQELFYRYPSIASGSIAIMPPEKAGIWSFPYPCYNNEQEKADDGRFWTAKTEAYKDGEETIFNMVTGILGNLYMSGRIDKCDELNADLIKEGVEFFKQNRDTLTTALPIWPCGTFTINQNGLFCTGLKSENKIILAVWNINAWDTTAVIDLSKYAGASAKVTVAYPANDTAAKCKFNPANRKLSVKLPDTKYSARIVEITNL